MTLVLRYAVRSDVGLLREGNEDSAYAGPRLLAVADGMGGHAAGEVASSLTIVSMAELDAGQPPDDMVRALELAVAAANARLQKEIVANPAIEGMGTTLTALLWSEGRAAVCHIGDSRGYLLRQGQLYQITNDHTLVQSLVDEGQISAEDVSTHPQRSLLLRALDGRSAADPDLSVHTARPGDRYLLCSDGLSGVVSGETLRDTLEVIDDPDAATRELIDLANAGGGPDNITCIVADVVDTATNLSLPDTPLLAGAAASLRLGGGGADPFGTARLDEDPTGPARAGTPIIMAGDDLDLDGLSGIFPVPATENGIAPGTGPARRSHRVQPRRSQPRRRWPIVTAALVVLAAVIVAGGYLAVQSTQGQYYLADGNGRVVIYRGIPSPAKVLWITLSRVYQPTGIPLAQVPTNYQPTVTSASAMGSLSHVQQAVATIRTAVNQCRNQYRALAAWVARDDKYLTEVAQAHKSKKPIASIPKPGPQPPAPDPMCQPSRAFGIAPTALSPTPAGRS
jgi:serine/threonine protein phosphatase PrpC